MNSRENESLYNICLKCLLFAEYFCYCTEGKYEGVEMHDCLVIYIHCNVTPQYMHELI